MSIRVGINGFGRIGRSFLRIVTESPELGVSVVAINDLAAPETLAYALKRDTIRGQFRGTVEAVRDCLVVNGHEIRVSKVADPAQIPWDEASVDVVLESTGRFRSGDMARRHLQSGHVRKVIVSASAEEPDAFIVWGVNEHTYDPSRHDVISPASCGVNALAVMAKVLQANFGLHNVDTTVVLASQGWQKIHDSFTGTSRDDPRLGRSMGQNIIPHPHVVGELLTTVLPQLGEIRYSYYVAPTPIGSLAILSGVAEQPVSVDAVNRCMAQAARGSLMGVLGYDDLPTVSSDVRDNPASCLFDSTSTQVTSSGGVKVMGWFDGEWGFANRLVDLVRLVGDVQASVPSKEVGSSARS